MVISGNTLYESVEFVFDKLIYPKHPELYGWEIDEASETLLLWVDMNKVDFTMDEIIDFETYYLLEEEYDHHTSDYFYDIITNDIIYTINKSLGLVSLSFKIDFIFSS